jgi:hypothetical protein
MTKVDETTMLIAEYQKKKEFNIEEIIPSYMFEAEHEIKDIPIIDYNKIFKDKRLSIHKVIEFDPKSLFLLTSKKYRLETALALTRSIKDAAILLELDVSTVYKQIITYNLKVEGCNRNYHRK